MASEYCVKQAYDDVVAYLQTRGSELLHDFGSEHLFQTRETTNFYVWVPVGSDRESFGAQRGQTGDGERSLAMCVEKFDVLCNGETHEVAILMAQNIVHSLCRVLGGMADLKVLGTEWEFPKDGESRMGTGISLQLHLGLTTVWSDRYVEIEPYLRVDQTPSATPVPTTEITSVEITTFSSPNVGTDGEQAAIDVLEDDD